MVTYRLALTIYDGDSETPHEAILNEVATLSVARLSAIYDRRAFDFLSEIIRDALVPEGSTIVERRETTAEPPSF